MNPLSRFITGELPIDTTVQELTIERSSLDPYGAHTSASAVAWGAILAGAAGAAAMAGTESPTISNDGGTDYFIDSLFRNDPARAAASSDANSMGPLEGRRASQEMSPARIAEVRRIIVNSVMTGELPADDVRYLSQVVAERTGLSRQDAQARVEDTYSRLQASLRMAEVNAKEAADIAREASAYSALWLFISLLGGAFFASWMATFGGRQRDA